MKHRLKELIGYHQFKHFFEKYERVLIPGMFVFGFLIDVLTFRSIQIQTSFVILGIYTVIAGASIIALNVQTKNNLARQKEASQTKGIFFRSIAPLTLQFTSGALLSASFIFYWFSGSLSVSWPIISLLAALMVSNEVFRQYYLRPVIQMSVFFFILFSLLALVLPFGFNSIDPKFFIYAGIGSFLFMITFVFLLSHLFEHIYLKRFQISTCIFLIFFLMNALYFLNIIPPIPLSLQEARVYHELKRVGQQYQMTREKEFIIDTFLPGQTIHLSQGKSLYVYSAIFAPTHLNTTIIHEWQFFDEAQRKWITKDRLSFSIKGGRDEGYRGYSFKSAVEPGKWRVNVKTKRGQVLGRVGFDVIYSATSPDLVLEVR